MGKIGINNKNQWNKKWEQIFIKYQNDTRNAYYVNSVLDENDYKVLELAAGSFRDTVTLNRFGIDCYGSDYSEKSVFLAKKMFPELADKFFVCDSFNLADIKDKSFDVSFHNGFWVLFEDNNLLIKLFNEQKRITTNKIIITVHNRHNESFVEYFNSMSQNDELYRIRFFEIDEIKNLLKPHCKKLEIIPVGKGKKYFEDELIKNGLNDRKTLNEYFKSKKLTNLENSERLMCVCYL